MNPKRILKIQKIQERVNEFKELLNKYYNEAKEVIF
jgi:hypothetical protein